MARPNFVAWTPDTTRIRDGVTYKVYIINNIEYEIKYQCYNCTKFECEKFQIKGGAMMSSTSKACEEFKLKPDWR